MKHLGHLTHWGHSKWICHGEAHHTAKRHHCRMILIGQGHESSLMHPGHHAHLKGTLHHRIHHRIHLMHQLVCAPVKSNQKSKPRLGQQHS